jgi:hypothetical protein
MSKTKEEKILDKIKQLYENYGIDIFIMEEEEFERILNHYKANPTKLVDDLKKSGTHANNFSDADII